MECSEKPILAENTRQELQKLHINLPDERVRSRILQNWDAVAKPIDGLGKLEKLIAQIGAVTGSVQPQFSRKAVLILCADNGIVEEQISQSGQEVTARVAKAMGQKSSSVGKMAALAGADTIPVDIGIADQTPIQGVLARKVRCGTRNFRKEPAMTEEEAVKAIAVGIELTGKCREQGYQLLATGEMGIGNTTTSSAVAAALLKCPVQDVTGRGAGLDDERLERKKQIIEEAVRNYDLYHADALTILRCVGGLDIAGLTGVCIGAALFQIPVVLDGVISLTAALLAERLFPGTKQSLLPSHLGKEPAAGLLLQELGMSAVLDAGLALGEGTGAVMLFPLLDMAMSVYREGTDFAGMKLEPYRRYDDQKSS